jgi:hypothetical protein
MEIYQNAPPFRADMDGIRRFGAWESLFKTHLPAIWQAGAYHC